MKKTLKIQVKGLFLPLRTTFKQASATRNVGESIWCEISRGRYTGYGEGCPRDYVTNETVENGLKWIKEKIATIIMNCFSLASLTDWIRKNSQLIDLHPAAFCAIETALLDLFAKEKEQSVEALLGLAAPQRTFTYTAVLGDSSLDKFKNLLQRYLALGFQDFKIKASGNFAEDQSKLALVHQIANYRIRLDANNYWKGQTKLAIDYLSKIKHLLFAIEEPIAPKKYTALGQISSSLALPIILDESLCNLRDLQKLDTIKGQFIANLKVSKVGGIIRTIELIKALQQRNIPIIIGAHVGETSILTRAGMCVAQIANESLIAQEGGFGALLLERDQVQPSLTIGQQGKINLYQSYQMPSSNGTINIPIGKWNQGWGLNPNQ